MRDRTLRGRDSRGAAGWRLLLLALPALLIAGCGGGTESEVDPASSTQGAQEWDPEAWEPTEQIEPTVYTGEERQRFLAELRELRAEEAGLEDPPHVEVIAWSESHGEFGDRMAECLQEAGFPAVSDGVGGTHYDPGVPASQSEALGLARFICESQYPHDPHLLEQWSPEQTGLVFDYWDEYFIPCMNAHGHHIGTSQQPSREAYVAAFPTQDRLPWWPSDTFGMLPPEEQRSLGEVCPPYPPDSAMYGQ